MQPHLHLFDQERLPLAPTGPSPPAPGVMANLPCRQGGRPTPTRPELQRRLRPFGSPLSPGLMLLIQRNGISTLSLGAAQPSDLAWARASAAPMAAHTA